MFDPALFLTYVAACFLFSIIPGPSVTLVLANSLARGTRAGLLTILGTEASMLVMVFVVAVGLQAVIALVGEMFLLIKLAGAAYLIWLGFKLLRSSGELEIEAGRQEHSGWRYFFHGAVVSLSNPKTLLFLGAFLPQFVALDRPTFPQILVLGFILMAVATTTDSLYAILAGSARQVLTRTRLKILNRVSGAILMAGGLWLALQKRI